MSAPRTDNRLDDVPMTSVACEACAARVLVRKASPDQTSIQWNADARAACHELATSPLPGPTLAGCSRLDAAVHDAVLDGKLTIVQEQSAISSA